MSRATGRQEDGDSRRKSAIAFANTLRLAFAWQKMAHVPPGATEPRTVTAGTVKLDSRVMFHLSSTEELRGVSYE